jgi:transcriptional regulator with XRE-family HTH domain
MAITNELEFTKKQLIQFARIFKQARLALGLTQLQVAQAAFDYSISHCKVSRVERTAMPKVDAHAIAQIASVLQVPYITILEIDPKFKARWEVAQVASDRGFWQYSAL